MNRPHHALTSSRPHIRPGRRGNSSAEPTRHLGTGQLTDSQLRRIERCAEKVPYTCQHVAHTAAVALGWCGLDVEPYRCPVCDLWHVTKTRSA